MRRGWRWDVPGSVVLVLCAALLSLRHGGVGGPFGALVPFGVVIAALRVRPRRFLVVAMAGLVAYWFVALAGAPAPPGYAVVCTLGPAVPERLRAALAERTGASLGTATLGRDGDGFAALYAHADANLYAEKRVTKARVAATPVRNRPDRPGADLERSAAGN